MYAENTRVSVAGDLVQQNALWADVQEVAEAAVGLADTPDGWVRRELPVGERRMEVYASVGDGVDRDGPAVVFIVATPESQTPNASELRRRFGLTRREAEVALLLAARRSNKEIAQKLSIAGKTAWRHTERVLSKLNTNSRRDVGRVLRSRTPSSS